MGSLQLKATNTRFYIFGGQAAFLADSFTEKKNQTIHCYDQRISNSFPLIQTILNSNGKKHLKRTILDGLICLLEDFRP